MSKHKDPNQYLLAEYRKYEKDVAEGDPMAFDDWLAGSDLPEIVEARELVKAQARFLQSNYTDPNKVYETGSDDTFWNSKVIRVGERFNVHVFDADGDRRPDREDSFADQALAIAFACKSVQRYSGRDVTNYTDLANMDPAWSNEHCEAAQREGWDIFDTQGSNGGPWQVQRFDDASEVHGAPQLKDDETAWQIVIQGTAAHHEAARQFIRTHSPKEWAALNQREVPDLVRPHPPA